MLQPVLVLLMSICIQGSVLREQLGSESESESCIKTLAEQNIERQAFATAVGHGIHSLYLEPLRSVRFFFFLVFFLNIFFGVPHSATFIFVIFLYVIASIAYIHPVYGAGVRTHDLLIVSRLP